MRSRHFVVFCFKLCKPYCAVQGLDSLGRWNIRDISVILSLQTNTGLYESFFLLILVWWSHCNKRWNHLATLVEDLYWKFLRNYFQNFWRVFGYCFKTTVEDKCAADSGRSQRLTRNPSCTGELKKNTVSFVIGLYPW